MDAVRYTRNYKIPANGSLPLDIAGEAIKHLRGSDQLTIAFDDGTKTDFALGVGYPAGSISPFSKITLYNDTANEVTGAFTWGSGNVDNDSLVIGDAVKIENKNGVKLETNDVDTQTILNDIKATLDAFAASPDIDLSNVQTASVTNATTTVVAAVDNTNGVEIPLYSAYAGNNNTYVELIVDGNIVHKINAVSGTAPNEKLTNILIPSGVAVVLNASIAAQGIVNYRIL